MQPSGFRTTSPAPVSQGTRKAATPTRGSSAGSMLKTHPQPLSGARQTPRTGEDGSNPLAVPVPHSKPPPKTSQPPNVNVQGGLRKGSPVSGYAAAHKSPVAMDRVGLAGDVMQKGSKGPSKPRLTQGNLTAARPPSTSGFPVNMSAGATPRSQYLDMGSSSTPRALPATPIVTVNPCLEVSIRHQGGTSLNKSGGGILDYKQGEEGMLAEAGGLQGRRVVNFGSQPRKSISSSPVLGVADPSRQKGGGGGAAPLEWGSQMQGSQDQEQRNSLQTAIALLQQNEILQQDAVLKDLLQMCVSRLTSSQQRRERSGGGGRVVLTSDSATQVQTMEACTQTDLPEFKEKRMKAKRRGERRAGAYSDSDVPSDATEGKERLAGGRGRRRRRNSLDESMSMSTNSPRESIDGYSRDLSDASGPISVSSLVQMSVASSTDASQTTTLPHDVAVGPSRGGEGVGEGVARAQKRMAEMTLGESEGQGVAVQVGGVLGGVAEWEGHGGGEEEGGGRQSVVEALQTEGFGLPQRGGGGGLGHGGAGGAWAASPSPSMETLMELQRILDEQYTKLVQTGVAGSVIRPVPARFDGLSSPATAEMRRLTMESALSLMLEDSQPLRVTPPDRPPNPDPTKRSPSAQLSPQSLGTQRWVEAADAPLEAPLNALHPLHPLHPRSVRMGNSPPKEVQKPLKQLHSVPTLNLPNARPRHTEGSVESPLSTPRSGSAFLAHVNSGPPSTTSGSAQSTPRAPYQPVTGITVTVGSGGQPSLAARRM